MKSAPCLHFLIVFNLLLLGAIAQAAPGGLDTTFNGTGKVTTDVGGWHDSGQCVALQSDGKIVVAGSSYGSSNYDFAVVRYHANGSLDTSFNGTGKVLTPVGSGDDYGASVVMQPDGKIVVAGYSHNGSNDDFAVVRYDANGNLDTSFNGTGKVTTPIGSNYDRGSSVAIQADGKIVVAGYSNSGSNDDFALVRYNANGSLDTSLSGTGKVTTSIGSSGDIGQSVAVQTDGKIVVAGYSDSGSFNYDFALVRYTASGSLDTSFNSTGKVTVQVGGFDYGHSLALQSDGKIVVAGYSNSAGNEDFALIRCTTNGSLDSSFNGTGKVITPVGSAADIGYSVMVQPDGKIVVAGYSGSPSFDNDFALVRYNANGGLDTSFHGTGKLTTPFSGSGDYGYTVALQSNGKIVVAGASLNGNDDFALARYEGLNTTTTNQSGVLNANLAIAPTAGAAEIYNNAGNNITNPNWTSVGVNGVGVLNFTGGTLSAPAFYAGEFAGSQGTLNLSAGTVTVAGTESVGHAGTATLYQTGGSNSGQNLYLGFTSTGDGTYILNASNLTVTNSTVIGYSGRGAFQQNGGTFTANGNAIELADQAGAYGSYQMSAGALNSTQILHVGYAGQGTFSQTGGDVSVAFVRVGTVAGATGLYELSGTGTLTTTSNVGVGFASSGTFNQSGGSVNIGGILSVGRAASGALTQSGGTSTVTGGLIVGEQAGGNGSYTLSAGTLTLNGHSHVGYGGTGTLTVSGGSVNLGATKDLYFGTNAAGVGTFNANGGTIVGRELVIADNGASTGTVNINGSTLTFANIRTGPGTKTLVFNKGTVNATATAISPGAGGLVVGDGTNAAVLNLGNGSHAISNGLHVKPAATLSLASSNLGGIPVALEGGTLTGNGTAGVLTASSGSVIDLGGITASTLSTTGNVTLASGVTYKVDLISGTTDQINVTGTVALGGATLNVTLRSAPTIGQLWVIVQNDSTDAVIGTFNGLAEGAILNLPNVGAGGGTYKARISYTGSSGNDVVLRIVDAPIVTLAAVNGITSTSATLNGTVNPNAAPTTANFEYGLTTSYGSTASVTLSPNNGTTAQSVSASLVGLTPGTTYYYRLTASSGAGTNAATGTFNTTPSNNANLANLSASAGAFTVPFGSNTTYLVMAPYSVTSTTLTPTVAAAGATVTVNGVSVASGTASGPIPLTLGDNPAISVVCTAPDGVTTKTYNVTVNRAYPAIGSLDVAFNGTGMVLVPTSAMIDAELSMVIRPDGKIDIVSDANLPAQPGTPSSIIQRRFNPDGSFASGVTNNFDEDVSALGAALQVDGKLLVVGVAGDNLALMRYRSDHFPDASGNFGVGGKVTTDFGGQDEGIDVAVQGDGKIVVCGTNGADFVIARYLSTGVLDTTFGTAGKVTTDFGGSETANNIIILSDGKILVSGDCEPGSTAGFAVARYLANGSLDSTFGTAGKVLTTGIGGENGCAWAMALQADGKFIVGGRDVNANICFAMVRYLANGTVDTSFGSNGFVRTTFGLNSFTEGNDIVIGPDGRILIAGTATVGGFSQFAMARYVSDGTLDTTFDGDGLVTTNFNSTDAYIASVKLQSDGQIIAAGNVRGADGLYSAVVVRYNNVFAPTVTTEAATDVTSTTATLHGTVNANGNTVAPNFRISTDQVNWTLAGTDQTLISGTTPQAITRTTLAGLTPGTLYYVQAQAEESNYNINGLGNVMTFRTPFAVPLSGGDDFNDNSKDAAKWAAADVVHMGGGFMETNGRLEYRVTAPDATPEGYDEVRRPWILNAARNTDAFEVVLDVFNNTSPSGTSNASIGLTVTSLENPQDSLFIELYRGGTASDGAGFLAAMTTHVNGGGEVEPFTVPSNHPSVTAGSVRISYDPVKKLFTTWYDATGSADGFQWQAYGSFGVGPGGGGMRNSEWELSAGQGFQISVTGFSEGMVVNSGEVYADNFQVGTGIAGWRLATFGTANPGGSFADDADPDHDGIVNLLEYALGLNPQASSVFHPPFTAGGGVLELTYERSLAALNAGTVFTVEWSDTLATNDWHTTGITEQILSDNGTTQQVKATVPAGSGGRRFVHLKVTAPP